MKVIAIIGVLLSLFMFVDGSVIQAQELYRGDNGQIHFESDAPLELIKASSDELKGILNLDNRSYAFSVEIASLEGFNNPLQKVHFNENYMESKEFPTASFSGKVIEKLDFDTPGTYSVRAKGTLKIHGIERERIIAGEMIVEGDSITIRSNFSVLLEDHSIRIPRIVHQKISETIEVDVNITLKKQ